jgi:hypothetical protein
VAINTNKFQVTEATGATSVAGTVTTNGGLTNPAGQIFDPAGITRQDVGNGGAAVVLAAGVHKDLDIFNGGSKGSFAMLRAPTMTNGQITAATTAVVDGITSDVSGSSAGRRTICQDAASHSIIVFTGKEGSTSLAANQIAVNADGNAANTSFSLGHRQCADQIYDPINSLWRWIGASDGVVHRFGISGAFTNTTLGLSVQDWDGGGTEGTNFCAGTRYRLASSATTTVQSFVGCNDGDIKIIQLFSTGFTFKHNGTTTKQGAIFLRDSVDFSPTHSPCALILQYDATNQGYEEIGGNCR